MLPASRAPCAGIHSDADIGLSQRGRVVRTVARHGDDLPAGLLFANELEFFRASPAPGIIDACFGGDRGGR